MRNYALIVLCLVMGVVMSACAGDFQPQPQLNSIGDGASHEGSKYSTTSMALKVDPITTLPQDCTPPYDSSCSSLGPNDQLTCLPTGVGTGHCALYVTDNTSVYNDPFIPDSKSTFDYISCPGYGTADDDDYCASKKLGSVDYVSKCIVTEETAKASGDRGRCAYFFKECTLAKDTPCEAKGYYLPDADLVCSVAADLSKAVTEMCDNGVDNNCNGQTDEENALSSTEYWLDGDGDLYGSTGAASKKLCAPANSYTATVGGDCNDSASSVNPGASESCNGVDDDCDSTTDEGVKTTFYADADNDTYGNSSVTTEACSAPSGFVSNSTDCNDSVGSVHPNATESCNGVDDDCDGTTDEGVKTTFYADADSDTYGNSSVTTEACSAPSGYVSNTTDCNDSASSVNPGASESCNGVDDDCDSTTDEGVKTTFYADADSDTYGNSSVTTEACSAPSGYVSNSTDCNDGAGSVHPNATESCNGTDDDCDGTTDEGVKTTFYADADNDTYGNLNATTDACEAPSGYVSNTTDCNDSAGSVNPGATDVCNQVDDNCDGETDVGANGQPTCDTSCPTVKKYTCNQEYTLDWSTLATSNTISSYQCWTAAGVKTVPVTFSSPEFMLAPNVSNGVKYSFQITTPGTGALAALLHGTCSPDSNTTSVTPYNPAKGLNGTCSSFGTSSVNGGVAGTDYVSLDKASATGTVKFKFICTP